jgi:hypothetical protein
MMLGTSPPLSEDPDLGKAAKAPMDDIGAAGPFPTNGHAQTNGAGPQGAAFRIRFTVFTAAGKRLAKLYKLAADGGIKAESRPEFSTGGYYVADVVAANPREALNAFGEVIDQLKSDCAIGLGVPLNGTGLQAKIPTPSPARWSTSAGQTPACCCSMATTSTGCSRSCASFIRRSKGSPSCPGRPPLPPCRIQRPARR